MADVSGTLRKALLELESEKNRIEGQIAAIQGVLGGGGARRGRRPGGTGRKPMSAAAPGGVRPCAGGVWSFHPVGAAFLVTSGLCEGTAYLTMWRALAIGNVSLVSPLVNSHALFAVLLAAVFLRDIEQVTWRIAVACVLTVAGVLLVILARSA